MKNRVKRVAIISRESNSKTLDIAMLEAELLKRGCKVKVLSRLLTKEKSLKALGYIGHVVKQEAAIIASDVVVLDTYCIPASMIPHRKRTKVVQMWHAHQAVVDGVIRESQELEPIFCAPAWRYKGYDVACEEAEGALILADTKLPNFRKLTLEDLGESLPRIDYIKSVALGERREDTAAKILSKYPQLKKTGNEGSPAAQRKTVLYVPTFRRGKAVDVQGLIDALDPGKYDLIVKLHPLYRGDEEIQSNANVIFDEDFSSYDWLSAADIIISDYSSYVIESTLADKPLFIYAYDLEDYAENTGLNIDFDKEPIAPYVFMDAKKLADCIGRTCCGNASEAYDINALRAFRDRYIDISTDNCTAALADFILSLS